MSNKQTEFDTALDAQLQKLNKTRQPERDLWPGIELALANQPAPNRFQDQAERVSGKPAWPAIAAVVAFIGVLGWVSLNLNPTPPSIQGQQLVDILSAQHQVQRDALIVKLQNQPALTSNWQKQLNELDAAAGAIKQALEQDPDNLALLRMLQHVHQQQIDLIERVHAPKWQQI